MSTRHQFLQDLGSVWTKVSERYSAYNHVTDASTLELNHWRLRWGCREGQWGWGRFHGERGRRMLDLTS